MKKIILLIRSIIFFICYAFTFVFILGLGLIVPIICHNEKMASTLAKFWNKCVIWLLKVICGVKYRVEGIENLPKDSNYIAISKHQSAWETYFLLYFLESKNKFCASYVFKKELLKVPIFGLGLKYCGNIAIDRSLGVKSLKQTISEAKYRLREQERNIVIFPQGTRTPITATTKEFPYKVGFFAIMKELKSDLVPIVLNTGKFWPKKSFIKYPGEIVIKILPVIKSNEIINLKKDEAIKKIEDIIETESNKLLF